MKKVRRRSALFLCLVITAFTTGCGIVDPCDIGSDYTMDGEWYLTHINATPFPSTGWPIPQKPNEFLQEGLLHFETTNAATHGSCNGDEMISTGVVHAVYVIRKTDPITKTDEFKSDNYAGTFEYDHRKGVVTLSALVYDVPGERFGDEFTVEPTIPGIGTFRGTFTRIQIR